VWETTGIHPFNPDKVLATIVRPRSPSLLYSKLAKTPSTRSLRRTYDRLRKEGKISQEASILLRAGEKLATGLETVRHENKELREAVIHEKKKRKRGKTMNLHDPGENEKQGLVFSPAKIARVHEHNADVAQAERQRKQNADDKKLRLAITRAEKAREAEEKRN
jgi:hypothetical protein